MATRYWLMSVRILIFVFNFNPKQSFTDYGFLVAPGAYEVILNTDNIAFGGNGFSR